MNKNILLALMLASLLTACNKASENSSANSPTPAASQSSDEQDKEQAQRAVLNLLKDPGSAQFRNVRKTKPGFVCGEVNAKNGMGGYVGFKQFEWTILAPNDAIMLSDTDNRCK